jgi:hypothetical protein
MQRYNIFNQVHKALRALLYETALYLQHTDFDAAGAQLVPVKIRTVIELFEKHAESEDCYIIPAVQVYEPSVADFFKQEHEKDHALCRQLLDVLQLFELAHSSEGKLAAGRELQQVFVDFMIFNLDHMACEERILNPYLWRYFPDAALQQITRQVVENIDPGFQWQYITWMLHGLNNAELLTWLKHAKLHAPDDFFKKLIGLAEAELKPQRWQQVQHGLTDGVLLACN